MDEEPKKKEEVWSVEPPKKSRRWVWFLAVLVLFGVICIDFSLSHWPPFAIFDPLPCRGSFREVWVEELKCPAMCISILGSCLGIAICSLSCLLFVGLGFLFNRRQDKG